MKGLDIFPRQAAALGNLAQISRVLHPDFWGFPPILEPNNRPLNYGAVTLKKIYPRKPQ